MACVLESLKAPPQINNLIPFLSKENKSYIAEEKFFLCCAATGLAFKKEGTKYSNCLKLCPLKRRLFDLNTLSLYQEKIWDHKFLPVIAEDVLKKSWFWLIHFKHKQIFKGYFTIKKEDLTAASYLWTLAHISIWRLGIPAFVYHLGKSKLLDFIKYCKHHENAKGTAPIIFLEIQNKLCNLNNMEELSYIINWCESAVWPLWANLYLNNEQSKSIKNPKLQEFYRRIEKKKNKDYLKCLPQDILSKLTSLCIKSS